MARTLGKNSAFSKGHTSWKAVNKAQPGKQGGKRKEVKYGNSGRDIMDE